MIRENRLKIKYRPHPSQSENIHNWQPWKASTGAKTPQGKAKVTQNLRISAAYREWVRCCKILGIDWKQARKIDAIVTPQQATKLFRTLKTIDPNATLRFKARLSANKENISKELHYSFDAYFSRLKSKLSAELSAIEKRLD